MFRDGKGGGLEDVESWPGPGRVCSPSGGGERGKRGGGESRTQTVRPPSGSPHGLLTACKHPTSGTVTHLLQG